MEMKMHMNDQLFYIDQEKKVIVCKIVSSIPYTKWFRTSNFPLDPVLENKLYKYFNNLIDSGVNLQCTSDGLKVEVSGKATCNDNDTFDEAIGRHIAETKAKIKLTRIYARILAIMQDYYSNMELDIVDALSKVLYYNEREINHLVDLVSE